MDQIVLQPSDIQWAINSKTPNINNKSSKFDSNPIKAYGFESCAFNAKVRRLPDGLGGGSQPRQISNSPDKRTALSQVMVSKYLPR